MVSMRCILITSFCALHFSLLFSETRVSGDISKITFNNSGNPYMVDSDIVVPTKKTVVVEEGCVILFKEFTGLAILGSFIAHGTIENPVIFSSLYDPAYNPASQQRPKEFDWNGMEIDKNADSVYLGNFKLMYSTYGIKAKKENIFIKNGFFYSNGQYNLTVNNKIYGTNDMITAFPVQQNVTNSIIVKSEPEGAFLVINGKPVNNQVTPDTLRDIKPGVSKLYAYKGEVEGCEEITLAAGESKEVVIVLKKSKSLLSISSMPQGAEVYINKKPGPRVEPDKHTPAKLKTGFRSQIGLTLFKKGYADTTLFVDIIPCQTTMASVTLRIPDQKKLAEQNNMLLKRWKIRIGRLSLFASPGLLCGAGGLFYLAQADYKNAKDANDFVKSMITLTPQYEEMKQKINNYNKKGDMKTNFGFALLGLGCIATGSAIVFYF